MYADWALRYARAVVLREPMAEVAGIASRWSHLANERVRRACARFLAEVDAPEAAGVSWDWARLEAFGRRCLAQGTQLMAYQCWVAAVIMARRKPHGGPATRRALFRAARGSGKTGFAVPWLEEAMATGDDVLVLSVSTNQEKANEVHERLTKLHQGSLAWQSTGGKAGNNIGRVSYGRARYKAVPCVNEHLDSIVASRIFLDEAARMEEAVNRAMTAVTKTKDGQLFIATTPDKDEKVRELYPHQEALERALDDDQPFPPGWWAFLYGMDPQDDPRSPEAVAKANPGVGLLGVEMEEVLNEINRMLDSGDPELRTEAYTQLLCTFTDDTSGALPLELVDRVSVEYGTDTLLGAPGVVAIDFSQGGFAASRSQCDLTSGAVMLWNGQRVHSFGKHWWAGPNIEGDETRTRQPLRAWRDQGHLSVCGGPVIDLDLVEAWLVDVTRSYSIKAFVADPVGKAAAWAAQMERRHGWTWYRAPQTIVWMGGAWAVFSEWVRGQKLQMQPDPVLRSCIGSARLLIGHTGLAMPAKGRSQSNIDALTAHCMAARALNDLEIMGGSGYETDAGF